MSYTIHDPFLNKQVEISNDLVDRLRGRYAVGPTLENGEPEFGWRQHETPAIQHAAALEITRLRKALEESVGLQSHYAVLLNTHDGGRRIAFKSAEEWLTRLKELGR